MQCASAAFVLLLLMLVGVRAYAGHQMGNVSIAATVPGGRSEPSQTDSTSENGRLCLLRSLAAPRTDAGAFLRR